MKIIASISLSFLFLTQGMTTNMDLCEQLEKFSNFISHYQIHKEHGGDSFYEYVVEEVFSDQGDDDAHHKGSMEDNTPRHTHHKCCNPSVFIAPSIVVSLKNFVFKEKRQYSYYYFQFNSRYLESPFQPPKV